MTQLRAQRLLPDALVSGETLRYFARVALSCTEAGWSLALTGTSGACRSFLAKLQTFDHPIPVAHPPPPPRRPSTARARTKSPGQGRGFSLQRVPEIGIGPTTYARSSPDLQHARRCLDAVRVRLDNLATSNSPCIATLPLKLQATAPICRYRHNARIRQGRCSWTDRIGSQIRSKRHMF